ncbi:MAG: flavin reductase [Oscillospiraceae bacterium]|nr:flavin reductase [Oscillospiraceae bacterium]
MNYKEINPKELQGNIFELIDDKWFLITAAKKGGRYNTMTASWGGMGIMWGKPVVWCVIRPVRYTYEFIEEADYYTISFYPDEYRKALNILGTKSGRDGDKVAESGFTPNAIIIEDKPVKKDVVFFEEADTVFICKKLYYQDINPDQFIDKDLDKNYPKKDYHRMYFGEIINCFVKE